MLGMTLLLAAVTAGDTLPFPVMLREETAQGRLSVAPAEGISGEFGTWTVTYTVGKGGIGRGGGIRVELPDEWHSGPRNSAIRLQATEPAADNYVSARASRPEVKLQTVVELEVRNDLVKHAKPSLDGRRERYVFVVRVRIEEGRLEDGDRIEVVYGDRSGGSRGHRAAAVSAPAQPVRVALDDEGTSRFRLHASRDATLTSLAGPAAEMLVHLPSTGAVGERLTGKIALVDKQYNPVSHAATVRLRLAAGGAELPASVNVPAGAGHAQFSLTPVEAGIVRLAAEGADLGLAVSSNPLQVHAKAPRARIYWGDLHSHTRFSWDGVGHDAFAYARRTSGLDFYAMTDHAVAPDEDGTTRGLSHASWDEYTALTERHHAPGEFVTLHAYECSLGAPYGHHNVYFRGQPGPLLYPQRNTLLEIWAALDAGEALTIPHHTGKFPAGVEFLPQNGLFRRNFEIYSGHGLSEAYDPEHPLAFERSKFTSDAKSLKHPSFAQDAWRLGLFLSTIASSDDHNAHPGMPHYGLVAVRAPRLTRSDIFQALFDRQTYGTTGAKIILELEVNGAPMGSIVAADGPTAIRVRAIGTGAIEWVDLLRYTGAAAGFETVRRWRPLAPEFEETLADAAGGPGAIYYVRLKQVEPVRGLAAMAWSSPVWTVGTRN